MKKTYLVDRISDDCIRVYPENQQKAVKPSEVKKRRVTMLDYGRDNGFSITPQTFQKSKVGTIFKIKECPLVTIHESKNKYFIRMSFTKATLEDAKMIMMRDREDWFAFLSERFKFEQGGAAVLDETNEKNTDKNKKSKQKS